MQLSRKFMILLVLVLSVQGQEVVQPGPPDFCIKTSFHRNEQYHKDVPSTEMAEFSECSSWQNLSCCTQALTESIGRSMFMGLYNWSYNLCGNLSTACAKYMRNEECFYWCEPMLGRFLIMTDTNVQRVPVCADYCDSWFEACKDDFTCYDNWEEAYNNASGMPNSCPEDSQCLKFSEVFADGRGLCNRMWGTSYSYSTDMDNCTVMAFDNTMPNPNYRLTFPRSGSLSTMVLGSNVMQVSAMLMYLLLTVAAIVVLI